MNAAHAEISKLKADLAKADKDREYWFSEAGRISRELAKERESRPSPGGKLYGRAEARREVSADLLAYARRAWESGEMISPNEIRDIALQLRKTAEADMEQGREFDRIAQDGGE